MKIDQNYYDIIVIGGGISGLSKAYSLQKSGLKVLLIEKKSFGGVIESVESNLGTFELGPNSFAIDEKSLILIKDLGLENNIIYADDASKKRYIFLNDKPTLINPKTLLFSNKVLSFKSKIRLITERFRPAKNIKNETLAQAIRRRFNDEILQNLINPVVSGIYAGDTEKLEYESTLKALSNFENKYGSFTKGFFKTRKSTPPRKIITIKGGLQSLPISIAAKLQHTLQSEVTSVLKKADKIEITTTESTFVCNKVIFATPAYVTCKLIENIDSELSTLLTKVTYPKLLGLQLVYPKKNVSNHLEAFGLLIPKQAGKVTMGIINYNTIFKTTDSENYQYNLFVRLAQNDNEDHLAKQAQSELESIYNISGSPIHSNHKVYKHAIPQFNVGYAEIINHVVEYEKRNPSIEFIGNWKTGVSIGDCIHL